MIKRSGILLAAAAVLALGACQQAASEETPAGPPPVTPTETDPAPVASGLISAAEFQAMVNEHGASAVLNDILSGPDVDARWTALTAGLASGDQAWIDVVPSLREALDGEAAEGVYSSLSEGLAFNAEGVLTVAGPDYMEVVCWNEDGGADPAATARNNARYEAVEALDPDGDLAALRYECMTTLSGEPT